MGRVPACRVERVRRTNRQIVRRRGSRSYRYVIRDEEKSSHLDAVLDQNAWGQVGWVYCCKSDSGKRKRSGIKIEEEL
jgi:hypothetical protein